MDVKRHEQEVDVMASNKRRSKTEELEATKMLETATRLLSRPMQWSRLHPSYWNLDCNPDDMPPPEYPELVDPVFLHFFQSLIQSCSHSADGGCDSNDCNLSFLHDSEPLKVWRIENKEQWDIYQVKRRKLGKKLGDAVPPVNPPLRTSGVQAFLNPEEWQPRAGEAFLFHCVSSEGAVFEIAEKGFNCHLAKSGNMFGPGC
mmetsp:Transcript_2228/g.5242  ORF Transcript_2228/g.5242 Transcript_2228/m.5242 type:complete len:202 (-) Transcript_2228:643-1248(-)